MPASSPNVGGGIWMSWQEEPVVEPATGKAAAKSLSLGRDPESPGTWEIGLGSSSWAGGSWPGLLNDMGTPNAS